MKADGIELITIEGNTFWTGSLDALYGRIPRAGEPHRLGCYLLLCLFAATGTLTVDNEIIPIEGTGVVCLKPNSICSLPKGTGQVVCFTEDFFSLRYNSNVLYQFSFLAKDSSNFVALNGHQLNKWIQLCQLMEEEFLAQSRGARRVLRSYLNILLCMLDQHSDRGNNITHADNKEERIRQFEWLLEEHYKTVRIPSFYAAKLHITTNYLNKLCQLCRNTSSGELIRKRVVIEAQRLLYHTALSVTEIAAELGFESISYFTTFFKKHTGTSPEAFRRITN